MSVAINGPKFYAWDSNGKPLAFGKLYTYQARTNIPKDTFKSEDQLSENTNPVILNGEGYADVYVSGSYKMVLKDRNDNEIWSSDPVSSNNQDEWVNCLSISYVSPTKFYVEDNYTDIYTVGRSIRINNGPGAYVYSVISSSVFSGGNTTVEIQSPIISVGSIYACTSILTNSSGSGLGGIEFNSVTEMKESSIILVGSKITTLGYNFAGDGGGADYIAASSGDSDGFVNHSLSDGLVALLEKTSDGYLMEQFGCFDGVDISERLRSALLYQVPIKSISSSSSYILSSVVRVDDSTVDFDLNGSELLHTELTNERCLLFVNNPHDPLEISDISFSLGRTIFTVEVGHGIVALDKIKSYSNENINPYSSFPSQRVAEYFVVDSVSSTKIVCIGRHIWSYAPEDNPRLVKLRENTMKLSNIEINRTLPHLPGEFAVAIGVTGYYQPEFRNIHAKSFTGQLLSVRSCFRAKGFDISATYLEDDAENSALGYVVVDYASQESEWHSLNGGKVRHTYTTGSNSIGADTVNPTLYGGAVRCHVYSGVTSGCTNFAYDTHQDSFECEFHDITVYDDYSTSESASGAFQDRGQNTIVHKITHISDGDDTSAGEVTVLFTTGARNTYIKEIVYKGRGTCLSSFALGEPTTSFDQSFRVDKITAYQPKFAPRIVRMNYPFTLSIGEINILPYDADRQYYGAGGVPYFSLNDPNANLTVERMNLLFNARNIVVLDPAGDYLCNMDGDFGKLRINIHTYTNSNTYGRFEKNLSGVRASVQSVIEDSVIMWTAHIDDWDESMTRNATFYTEGEVSGNMKFKYSVLGDGEHKPDTSLTNPVPVFEASTLLRTFEKSHFGLTITLGNQLDDEIIVSIEGRSTVAEIDEITIPSFAGQKLHITNLPWNPTGIIQPVDIKALAVNTDLSSDRIVAVGESLTLTAYKKGVNLVWHVPN